MRRPGARWWSANGKTAKWRSVTVASDCAMKKSRCVRPHRRWQLSRGNTDGGCRHRHRPATHGEKAIDKSSRKGGQHSEKPAVEMAERWKAWKSKGRISPLPTVPWNSRKLREIPTFPQLRREAGGWKSGKPKAGFPLSHRHESPFSRKQTRTTGGLRPPPGGGRFAPPKSQTVVVVDRENS